MTGITTIFFIIVSIGYASGTESLAHKQTELLNHLLHGYSADVIPQFTYRIPLNCSLSLEPIRLLDADFEKREIEILYRMTMVWHDFRLRWDRHNGISQLVLPANRVWRPDLVVYNGVSEIVTLNSIGDQVVIFATGDVTYIPTVKIRAFCQDEGTQCDHENEVHGMACDIKLGSWVRNGFELDLYPEDTHVLDPNEFSKASDASVTFSKPVREQKFYRRCPAPFVSNTFPIHASHLHDKW